MAKRKRPRINDLRQGQTIYVVCMKADFTFKANAFLLSSHNKPMAELGCSNFFPRVNAVKQFIRNHGSKTVFYKRSGAIKLCKIESKKKELQCQSMLKK